jgi:hypothetical protein
VKRPQWSESSWKAGTIDAVMVVPVVEITPKEYRDILAGKKPAMETGHASTDRPFGATGPTVSDLLASASNVGLDARLFNGHLTLDGETVTPAELDNAIKARCVGGAQ